MEWLPQWKLWYRAAKVIAKGKHQVNYDIFSIMPAILAVVLKWNQPSLDYSMTNALISLWNIGGCKYHSSMSRNKWTISISQIWRPYWKDIPYTQSSNMHSSITSELPDPKKIERDSLIVFTHFIEEVCILHFGTLNQGYL